MGLLWFVLFFLHLFFRFDLEMLASNKWSNSAQEEMAQSSPLNYVQYLGLPFFFLCHLLIYWRFYSNGTHVCQFMVGIENKCLIVKKRQKQT